MIKFDSYFGLSIAPPDPGCEYVWKYDPTWGQVPNGQVCSVWDGVKHFSFPVIVVVGLAGLVIYLVLRRRTKHKQVAKK